MVVVDVEAMALDRARLLLLTTVAKATKEMEG